MVKSPWKSGSSSLMRSTWTIAERWMRTNAPDPAPARAARSSPARRTARPRVQRDVVVGGLNPVHVREQQDDDLPAGLDRQPRQEAAARGEVVEQRQDARIDGGPAALGDARARAIDCAGEPFTGDRLEEVVEGMDLEGAQRVPVVRRHEDDGRQRSAGERTDDARIRPSPASARRAARRPARAIGRVTALRPSPDSPATSTSGRSRRSRRSRRRATGSSSTMSTRRVMASRLDACRAATAS